MEINYVAVRDYLLPAVKLSDPPDAPPLGRYGMMHKFIPAGRKARAVRQIIAHGVAISAVQGS